VDDGIGKGTKVSPYYDPMLAKVITWGDNRLEAVQRMIRALQDTVILGVTTNIPYLIDILHHPEFTAGRLSTKFLNRNLVPWQPSTDVSNSTRLALAAFEAVSFAGRTNKSEPDEGKSTRPQDPWGVQESWRN
jgi:acetyl/propionyl-CoA carboxylase alpha subunit